MTEHLDRWRFNYRLHPLRNWCRWRHFPQSLRLTRAQVSRRAALKDQAQ